MAKSRNSNLEDLDISFQSENFSGHGDLGAGILTLTHRIISKTNEKRHSITQSINGALVNSAYKSLDNENEKKSQGEKEEEKTKRTIIIEPALAMMITLFVSTGPLTGQYIYWVIGEANNLTAILGNATLEGGKISECDIGDNNETREAYLVQQAVQAETAEFLLLLELCGDFPNLIVALFMGTWMDNVGRKPALILPIIGVIIQNIIFIIQQSTNASLYFMIFGVVVNALTGGVGTFIDACYSYIADTVPPSKRGRRVVTGDLVYGVLMAAGQIIVGYLIESMGFLYPYIILMAGHMVNLLYVIFFVPESKTPPKKKKPVSPRYIMESFKVLAKKRPGGGRRVLLFGLLARGVLVFFVWPRRAIQSLYLLNSPLCWNPSLIGLFTAFSLLVGAVSQLAVTLFLLRKLREMGVLLLSVSCGAASVAFLAFSTKTWMVFLVPVVGFCQGATLPLIRALLSNLISTDEQGGLFSCLSATTSVVDMIGGIVFNLLYASTLLIFKGTAFLVMSAGLGITLAILFVFRTHYNKYALSKDAYPVPSDNLFAIT